MWLLNIKPVASLMKSFPYGKFFDKQILHICRKAERRKKREKHEDEESASALLW